MDLALPWARPVPAVFWFDRRLRVWLSAQHTPAPLAVVIAGTGGDGNTTKLADTARRALRRRLSRPTMPSPTFPGFIVSASSTGVAGDLVQDRRDLYASMQPSSRSCRAAWITDIDILGYSLGGANAAVVKSIDTAERKLHIHRAVMINPPVSLFASVARLDRLFATSIGTERCRRRALDRRLYAQLANLYRASNRARWTRTSCSARRPSSSRPTTSSRRSSRSVFASIC